MTQRRQTLHPRNLNESQHLTSSSTHPFLDLGRHIQSFGPTSLSNPFLNYPAQPQPAAQQPYTHFNEHRLHFLPPTGTPFQWPYLPFPPPFQFQPHNLPLLTYHTQYQHYPFAHQPYNFIPAPPLLTIVNLPRPPIILRSWVPTQPIPFLDYLLHGPTFLREQWLREARTRRDYYTHAHPPPIYWLLMEAHHEFPNNALQTGAEESGEELYSIRSHFNGGLHLGKAGRHLLEGGSIAHNSKEHSISCYEVLVGDSSHARWVSFPPTWVEILGITPEDEKVSPLSLTPLASPSSLPSFRAPKTIEFPLGASKPAITISPFCPLEGGFEMSTDGVGSLLLVTQAPYEGGWHPGHVVVGSDHCCFGWGGGEVWSRNFRVLIWDSPT